MQVKFDSGNIIAQVLAWLFGIAGFYWQITSDRVIDWRLPAFVFFFPLFLALGISLRRNAQGNASNWKMWLGPLVLIISGAILHAYHIRLYPIWASEAFILDDVASIISGRFVNPLSNSGDFPTTFFSYLATPLAGLTPDVQVGLRMVGVIAIVLFAVLIYESTTLIGCRHNIWVFVFIFCSIWLINLSNTADNNWLCLAPCLCALQFLLYLKIVERPNLVPLFAAVSAVAIWTLYMPAIFSLGIFGIFLLDKQVCKESKIQFCSWFMALLMPLLGRILYNGATIDRHWEFISQTGEGELGLSLFEGYWRTFKLLGQLILPDSEQAIWPDRKIFIEPVSLALLLLGILLSPLCFSNKRALKALYFIAIFCLVGFVCSNPVNSFWRAVILAPPAFIFVALGLDIVLRNLKSLGRAGLMVTVAICVAHVFTFGRYYYQQITHRYSNKSAEGIASYLYHQCLKGQKQPMRIILPALNFPAFVTRLLSRNSIQEVRLGEHKLLFVNSLDVRSEPTHELIIGRHFEVELESSHKAVSCLIKDLTGQTVAVLLRKL